MNHLLSFLQKMDSTQLSVYKSDIMGLIENEFVSLRKAVRFNPKSYCKTTLFKNEKLELVIIGWEAGQSSGIHNHPAQGCLVFPLEGTFIEKRFDQALQIISMATLRFGSCSYMHDEICLHSLGNASSTGKSISLHLYAPPNFVGTVFQTEPTELQLS